VIEVKGVCAEVVLISLFVLDLCGLDFVSLRRNAEEVEQVVGRPQLRPRKRGQGLLR